MIEFLLHPGSGVSPYLQIVQQVRQALRLGLLREGDQLPTIKAVVAQLAINPNTVLKAYRELEHEGLVQPRPGAGTFVLRTLADDTVAAHDPLRADLQAWLDRARRAGLDDDSIEALFWTTFRVANRESGSREDGHDCRGAGSGPGQAIRRAVGAVRVHSGHSRFW